MTGQAMRRLWQNLFVVSGGLLFLWSILATIYLQFFRVPQRVGGDNPQLACDFGQIYSGGACTSPAWMFMMFGVIGLGAAISAAIIFRSPPSEPSDVLRAGPGTRLSLAFVISLAIVPLAYLGLVSGNAGDPAMEEWIRWGGTAYSAAPFLAGTAAVGLIAGISAITVHVFHESLRRRFLAMQAMEEERDDRKPPARHWESHHDEPRGALPSSGFRWEAG